ncbi:MAG: amidohydrolase family protein [Nitrospirae bacterium]|nr:amidohydrolase family protein [Nitrospirota bacterium]
MESMSCKLIDIHTHGLDGVSARSFSPDDFRAMAILHGTAGTGTILPTLYPAPLADMRRSMAACAEAMRNPVPDGAEIIGMNIEGPFLNTKLAGALDPACFLTPSAESLARLLDGFEDLVKIITIAPERSGALAVIERCAELGIRASMGHSGATLAEAAEGKRAGASGITHLFNAMRGIHHREPGLAGFGLTDPDVYVEIIADGVHVSPWMLDLVFRLKPPDRIIAVSDSVEQGGNAGSGLPPKDLSGRLMGGAGPLGESLGGMGKNMARAIACDNPRRYLGI